jgi:hypothetical protein
MAQRGRKGSKGTILDIVDLPGERAPPPPELSEEVGKLWTDIVRGMRSEWWTPAMAPLLEAYCVQAVFARRLEREMDELPLEASARGPLAAMHRDTARTLASLAVKLRMTPSARRPIRDERTSSFRPWEPGAA